MAKTYTLDFKPGLGEVIRVVKLPEKLTTKDIVVFPDGWQVVACGEKYKVYGQGWGPIQFNPEDFPDLPIKKSLFKKSVLLKEVTLVNRDFMKHDFLEYTVAYAPVPMGRKISDGQVSVRFGIHIEPDPAKPIQYERMIWKANGFLQSTKDKFPKGCKLTLGYINDRVGFGCHSILAKRSELIKETTKDMKPAVLEPTGVFPAELTEALCKEIERIMYDSFSVNVKASLVAYPR